MDFLKRADALAQYLTRQYSEIPEVEAVCMAGSLASGQGDSHSDIDLYIYSRTEVPLDKRRAIATRNGDHIEINKPFWGPEDAWTDRDTGIKVDIVLWDVQWIEDRVKGNLERFEASTGYSTCFWYTVLKSRILFDRNRWFAELQQFARQPYPDALQKAILDKNLPVLRGSGAAYPLQIARAVENNDPISINHRITELLASYFDILFALNRLPHPGEKRLLTHAARCEKRPPDMTADITALIQAIPDGDVVQKAETLIDKLEALLKKQD